MSYRGFGQSSQYNKGIDWIARNCYLLGCESVPFERLLGYRAMLIAMTGRSEESVINDVQARLIKLAEERRLLREGWTDGNPTPLPRPPL